MANLRRYTLPMVLAVIALALLTVGVLSLTVWKPQQEVVAERSTDQPFTMTRAGVLSLYADEVEVRASTDSDEIVWLAVGSPDDVAAWLQNESYDEVTGLQTLTELKAIPHVSETDMDSAQSGEVSADTVDETADEAVEEATEEEASTGVENPISSDMWTAVKYGRGGVSLTLSGDELGESLLAATDGVGPAPVLTLIWKTPTPNILAAISFILTGVFAVLALAVWGMLYSSRSRRRARSKEIVALGEQDVTETQMIEAVPAEVAEERKPVLTRSRRSKDKRKKSASGSDEPQSDEQSGNEPGSVSKPKTGVDEPSNAGSKSEDERETDAAKDVAGSKRFAPQNEETETDAVESEGSTSAAIEKTNDGDRVSEPSELSDAEQIDAEQIETVSTDSGMLNLAALQGGGAYPTRRALMEAQSRGVDALLIEGRRFSTRRSEARASKGTDTPEDILEKRSVPGLSWSDLMRRSATARQSDPDDTGEKGE